MNRLVTSFITESSCYREIKAGKAYCILFEELLDSDNCSAVYVSLSNTRKYIQVFTLERLLEYQPPEKLHFYPDVSS